MIRWQMIAQNYMWEKTHDKSFQDIRHADKKTNLVKVADKYHSLIVVYKYKYVCVCVCV
jgi:hypothetical protein